MGMKYMLATLCSNPAATKALIGNTIAMTLSVTDRPPVASHTARQTRAFASTPRIKTTPNGSEVFIAAIVRAVAPTAPSDCFHHSAIQTIKTMLSAPMKFPAYTRAQLRISRQAVMRRLTKLMTSRLFRSDGPLQDHSPAFTVMIGDGGLFDHEAARRGDDDESRVIEVARTSSPDTRADCLEKPSAQPHDVLPHDVLPRAQRYPIEIHGSGMQVADGIAFPGPHAVTEHHGAPRRQGRRP
jgi:hypothetical protein